MHDQFRYDEFRLSDDATEVSFDYTVIRGGQRHLLTEVLKFPQPLIGGAEQLRSLRALHLALGVSYYKIFVPDTMVHPYAMDEAEADFWNNVWQNGLGEFLYVNKLPAERLARFSVQAGQSFEGPSADSTTGALLGIGGGKDSIVAGELLKALHVPVTGFVMATGEVLGQAGQVAETMQVGLQAVERRLDKRLLDLQKQPGAYHGHIPISLIFGLVGTALAIAGSFKYVIVANEASASIPRITWNGQSVNHQWSKSFGFEERLQQYIHENISAGVTYFSAIRQLTSIGVAKIFARYPQYFETFTSDNFVFRIDPARRPAGRWSLESPKSLSSYILLAPWLSDADVDRIFGIDFLNQTSLEQLFFQLTGVEGEPPLDCVGTVEELVLSLNLLAQRGRYDETHLMRLADERNVVSGGDWDEKLQSQLQLQPDEALPADLQDRITDNLEEALK